MCREGTCWRGCDSSGLVAFLELHWESVQDFFQAGTKIAVKYPSIRAQVAKAEICSICLEPVTATDELLRASPITGCPHIFHFRCGAPWVDMKGTCPVCQQPVWRHGMLKARLEPPSLWIHSVQVQKDWILADDEEWWERDQEFQRFREMQADYGWNHPGPTPSWLPNPTGLRDFVLPQFSTFDEQEPGERCSSSLEFDSLGETLQEMANKGFGRSLKPVFLSLEYEQGPTAMLNSEGDHGGEFGLPRVWSYPYDPWSPRGGGAGVDGIDWGGSEASDSTIMSPVSSGAGWQSPGDQDGEFGLPRVWSYPYDPWPPHGGGVDGKLLPQCYGGMHLPGCAHVSSIVVPHIQVASTRVVPTSAWHLSMNKMDPGCFSALASPVGWFRNPV